MKRILKRFRTWLVILAGLTILIMAAGIAVFRSAWFYELVRSRIVQEVEKTTGGRAEVASYSFRWETLTAQIDGFVLHGTEASGQEPLFRADSVRVRLRIVSILERKVDLASIEVIHPRGHIMVRPDGSSNIPGPRIAPSSKNPIEQILDLKIGRFALRDGSLLYNSEVLPLDADGEGLRAGMTYEQSGPQYRGEVRASNLRVSRPLAEPLSGSVETSFLLRRNRIVVLKVRIALPQSSLEASGEVDDLASPHGKFSGKASLRAAGLVRALGLPELSAGEIQWSGTGSFAAKPLDFAIEGKLTGSGLAIHVPQFEAANISLSGNLKASAVGASLDSLAASCPLGRFNGAVNLKNWRDLQVSGSIGALSLQAAAAALHQPGLPWSASLRGPVKLSGQVGSKGIAGLIADGHIDALPATGGIPLSGNADWKYNRKVGLLHLGDSGFTAGSTKVDLSGTLGGSLRVTVVSRNLNDILPAFRLAGLAQPESLPFSLNGGAGRVEATVTGPLRDPDIQGHAAATNFVFQKHSFDRVESDFEVSRLLLRLDKTEITRGNLNLKGSARAALLDWKLEPSSAVAASVTIRNADIKELLSKADSKLLLSGMADADLRVSETFGDPLVQGTIAASDGKAWEQTFNQAKGEIRFEGSLIQITKASVTSGNSHAGGSVAYRRSGSDWETGDLQFDVSAELPDVAKVEALRQKLADVAAGAKIHTKGAAHIAKGEFRVASLDGTASFENVSFRGSHLGSASFNASTSGSQLRVQAQGKLLDSDFHGEGEWRMDGDHNGQGKVDFSPVSLRKVAAFFSGAQAEQQLNRFNFSGSVGGTVTVEGPLDSLDKLRAQLRLPVVEVRGAPQIEARAGAKAQDLVIRSAEPVIVDVTSKAATIRAAHFNARDTQLSLAGAIAFDSAVPSSLRLDGSINLAVLQLLNKDLLAAGHARVSATLRGTLSNPNLNGRMDLTNASLFLPDLPNGVDNANGVITFDRNRATIQSLTAETGGGKISFSGFAGFGALLVYHLEATADQVRYRTPEGASVTANALLNLVGTSENSVLSGSVSIVRANLPPLADIGSLVAASSTPSVAIEQPNEYLRGIHLDIAIESAQSLEVRTSLARDLQTSVDLRLRGTPQLPSLMGSVTANQGEIQFFGTRYTIDRGEVQFSNPLKIEPNIDVNLETRVRGIEVNLTVSGTPQKLNLSYRSDPPLESGQIIALLAVGRDPTAQGLVNPNSTQGNAFGGGAGSLLAGALTAPLTSRLDRLFGGSSIKIDPQATDLTTIPQARLVFEQPISKDITLTYITNLNRTDEQVVRVEWDFNNTWSAVASREENGLFGIVFQYRKRFK